VRKGAVVSVAAAQPGDWYTRFVSSVLFPLHERLKNHDSCRRLRALETTQWLDKARLEELQLQNLRRFLVAIDSTVPYYTARFAEVGLVPGAVTSLADLTRVPFLTKPLIREHVDRLKARGAGRLIRYTTGGSSGEPLVFYMGRDRVSHDVAAKWRATRWWGVDIGDPEIVVWGSPIELGAQDRVRRLRDRVLRTELLPAFDMSASNLDAFIERIRARRPNMLFGYPSALAFIARHAELRHERLDGLGIRVAFVTSECLYEHQRRQIERTFGCRVANGYGGRDAGFIAHECPMGSLHVTAEDLIVELIDGEGRAVPTGQSGEIVITHLTTRDFPFVRYRTGDVGVLDDRACPCGRGLPVLREVRGRTTDFVVAMDGTVLHGLALIYVVRDLPGIRTFRIVQESLAHTRVSIVPESGFDDRDRVKIREGIRSRLGNAVSVDVDLVESIAAERSGKHRYIVSMVPVEGARDE
jgi:phenylacetate-CoA ligase